MISTTLIYLGIFIVGLLAGGVLTIYLANLVFNPKSDPKGDTPTPQDKLVEALFRARDRFAVIRGTTSNTATAKVAEKAEKEIEIAIARHGA